MITYFKYILRRAALVLLCLGSGLVAWPGDVGAQSLFNPGAIDASGARRIKVEPSELPERTSEETAETPGVVGRVLGSVMGMMGGGSASPGQAASTLTTVLAERDKAIERAVVITEGLDALSRIEGTEARIAREAEQAAKAARQPTQAEMLFAEFGAPEPVRTPYDVVHAAVAAR